MSLGDIFTRAVLMLVASFVLHTLYIRIFGNLRFVFKTLVWMFVFAAVSAVILPWEFSSLLSILFYAFLWIMYLIFLVNLLNSFSLRMALEIDRSQSKALTRAELDAMFSDAKSFESRLQAMHLNQLIERDGGDIALTKKGVSMAGLFKGVRKVFKIKTVG